MKHKKLLLERLADGADLSTEPLPLQPLVEIAGEGRVLIENHHGVTAYSDVCISARVRYGVVHIYGCGLELCHMSKQQLVITGKIDKVELCRKGESDASFHSGNCHG